jgi:hypothetical protein
LGVGGVADDTGGTAAVSAAAWVWAATAENALAAVRVAQSANFVRIGCFMCVKRKKLKEEKG